MAKVLIIDDNDEFRAVFREMLEKAGYEVMEASSGDAGIDLYRRSPADVVVTDIVMPGKEGLETMLELRREFPGVKLIAMSGGGFEDPATYLEGAELIGGAVRTFAKPFSMEAMFKAIKEVIGE